MRTEKGCRPVACARCPQEAHHLITAKAVADHVHAEDPSLGSLDQSRSAFSTGTPSGSGGADRFLDGADHRLRLLYVRHVSGTIDGVDSRLALQRTRIARWNDLVLRTPDGDRLASEGRLLGGHIDG